MTNHTLTRTKYTFYLYLALASAGFMAPFLIIFLTDRGITFRDLALAGSTMAVVSNFAEFPTGYISDRYGRRASLIASQTTIATATTGYLFAQNTTGIVVVFGLMGLAVALRSGSESAWLYDIFDEQGEADQFLEVRSRAFAIGSWTGAVTVVIGTALYYFLNPVVPLLSLIVAEWVAVAVLFFLPKNARFADDADAPQGVTPREVVGITRTYIGSPAVRTLIGTSVIVGGAVYAASQLIQPTVLASTEGAAFSAFGARLPDIFVLGAVYAAYEALSGTLTDYAKEFEELVGTAGAILSLNAVTLLAMITPAVIPVLTPVAVLAFRTFPHVGSPISMTYLNGHADSLSRASVLSGVSVVRGLVRIPFLAIGGTIADLITPTTGMAVVGATALILWALVILGDRPFLIEPS